MSRPPLNNKLVGVNMPVEMAAELERRAKSMRLSTVDYCRRIIKMHFDSGEQIVLTDE
ncbi:MAG: hypothetical protein WC959_10615 [Kiritimatiellales bacterium]